MKSFYVAFFITDYMNIKNNKEKIKVYKGKYLITILTRTR